jgi:hypothetical protein
MTRVSTVVPALVLALSTGTMRAATARATAGNRAADRDTASGSKS